MTSSRNTRGAKSNREREAYVRYIRKQDYEPTVDDTLSFAQSSTAGEELSKPTASYKRPIRFQDQIKIYIKDHWLEGIFSIVILLLLYFMIDSKIDMAKATTQISNIEKNETNITQDLNAKTSKDHEQDLDIRENKIRIEQLEKSKE